MAKKWPENLGVGRPYDVDERLEDFLLAWCYSHSGNKKTAVEFSTKAFTGVLTAGYTASSSGDLISALALKNSGKQSEADNLMNSWQRKDPDNITRQWCAAVYSGDRNQEKKFAEAINLSSKTRSVVGPYADPDLDFLIKFRKITGE